jgi:exoribonuclease R
MLLYNREVARILKTTGQGVLRRHAGKDLTRYEAYAALGLPADRLAMHGGEYCLPTEADSKHWGLGVDAYCHASSPIRRWADCMNQLALRETILVKTDNSLVAEYSLIRPSEEHIAALNDKSKRAKAYERDVHFARILLRGEERTGIEAIVAEVSDTKTKLWVPKWNRMISSKQVTAALGDHVTMSFFADPKQRSWKRRVVVEFQKETLSIPV